MLLDGSRVHTFDNGRAIDVQPGVRAPLLVTADVYALPLECPEGTFDPAEWVATEPKR